MMKLRVTKDKVWFASDLHLNHKNIVKELSSWEGGGDRDFKTVEQMNATILDNINDALKPDDHLFLLGDTLFGDKDYVKFARSVNCDNVYIMPGNHCHIGRLEDGEKEGYYQVLPPYFEMSVEKQVLVTCHYPILSFNHMNIGAWMLYGHVHAKIHRSNHDGAKYFNKLKTLDVGIDNANDLLGSYRPFNLKYDIEPFMQEKQKNSELDHH